MKNKMGMLKKCLSMMVLTVMVLSLMTGCGGNDELSASMISQKLEPMSELVSAKLTYNGVIQYSEGNVPFFTQKEFLMVYRAEVKAGIDLSAVEIEISDKDVKIRLPEETTLDVKVDPDSIVFYAEKTAIFNKDEKNDAVEAIKAAEEDVKENGGIEELKAMAREEAALLISGMLESAVGERQLVVLS